MDLTVRPTVGRDDDDVSLAICNEVWPKHAVTMAEVDSFKRSALAEQDHLAVLEGTPLGSGFVAILPARHARLGYREAPGRVLVRGPLFGG